MTAAIAKIEAGQELPEWSCVVTPALQRRYHEAAEVPEGLFGDRVDVSVLANQCLVATAPLRRGRKAGLHMGHRVLQLEPVGFGETLTVRSRIGEVAPMATGTRLRVDLEFVRADGSVPVTAESTSLRPDARAMRSRGPRPEKVYETEGFAELARRRLTPERVMGYSHEFPDDKVHFDLGVAQSIGFRVPVAQGLMSLTWMSAAVAADGVPREIDIAAQFRGPIFWDDEIVVLGRAGREFQVRNAAGKVCSLGRVARLVR